MSGNDLQALESAGSGEALDAMLIRLRQVRRRLERWVPSSPALALLCNDYSAVVNAAKRLEASVSELDSGMETIPLNPQVVAQLLGSLIEKLERCTSEFESSILNPAAVA